MLENTHSDTLHSSREDEGYWGLQRTLGHVSISRCLCKSGEHREGVIPHAANTEPKSGSHLQK